MILMLIVALNLRYVRVIGEIEARARRALEEASSGGGESVEVEVEYTELEEYEPSSVASLEVLRGEPIHTDVEALDERDGVYVVVDSEIISGGGGGGGTEELVSNGDFEHDLDGWSSTGPWTSDTEDGNGIARCTYFGNRRVAELWQEIELGNTPSEATLSFDYYMHASFPPWVRTFQMVVSIVKDGWVVWTTTIDWTSSGGSWRDFSADVTSALTEPGTYTLKFTVYMRAKGKLVVLFITKLDNVSLLVTYPGQPPTITAYVADLNLTLSLDSYYELNCSLLTRLNATALLEVYAYIEEDNSWTLKSKYYAVGGEWFNVTFNEEKVMLHVESDRPFRLELEYLEISALVLGDRVVVWVENSGQRPLELYAIWLRNSSWEYRADRHTILFPYELESVELEVKLTLGSEYEVRVVTARNVYSVVFEP